MSYAPDTLPFPDGEEWDEPTPEPMAIGHAGLPWMPHGGHDTDIVDRQAVVRLVAAARVAHQLDKPLMLSGEALQQLVDLWHVAEGMSEMTAFTSRVADAHARRADRWRRVAIASLSVVMTVALATMIAHL